jgi:alkanesulfonate monooxygenase SsuD/methylene tetrahydromethanopterin reductase-like flavin-dependent oxidoreductase (luciferase family)
VKFGIWHDFRNPARWRRPYAQLYAENLEQIAWAEAVGFESVWLSEHHVTDEGYLPSMFPMLAAIATRTRTMRLGTAVLLGPFQHPIRFAEDAAVVDQLSGGRLELGVGLGYRETEFEALGILRAERASRTEELVQVARLAWTGAPFRHQGHHWRFEDAVVTPPPFQRPSPPVWIGGSTPAAARRAARLGCHFFPDAYAPVRVIEIYRQALEAEGLDPACFRVATNPSIYVSEDPNRGWDEVKDHFLYQYNRYSEWAGGASLATAGELPRDRYIVGTPDQVAGAVRTIADRTGCDRLIFWARPPGLSIERSNASLELFVQQVMPRVP